MKRLILLIAVVAVATPFIYHHGPDYIKRLNRAIDTWLVESATGKTYVPIPDKPTTNVAREIPAQKKVDQGTDNAVKASLGHLRKNVPVIKTRSCVMPVLLIKSP